MANRTFSKTTTMKKQKETLTPCTKTISLSPESLEPTITTEGGILEEENEILYVIFSLS